MFRPTVLLVLLVACGAAIAQAPATPTVQESPTPEGRKNQKIERIRVEDDAVKIDELRVGGQTQAITVKPKHSALPAYEILPSDPSRHRATDQRDGPANSGGTRVWNFFNF